MDAIQYANRMIIDAIDEHPEYSGMGTTLTFAYLEPATLTIGHVGDSSAYLIGGGRIKKITRDHTYMQKLIDCGVLDEDEIDDFPLRNVITRALGSEPLQVDIYKERWLPGDRLLLCSDGLTAYADRDYLFRELTGDAEKFEDYALRLVDYALSEGGRDNISVIVIENTDEQGNAS